MLQGHVLYKGIERKQIEMKVKKQPEKTSTKSKSP